MTIVERLVERTYGKTVGVGQGKCIGWKVKALNQWNMSLKINFIKDENISKSMKIIKLFIVHGLEELISFKCQYCQSTLYI